MKRSLIITLIMIFVLASTVGGVFAASTTKSLSTNFTLVNLGPATAHGTIDYYKTDGSVWDADSVNETFELAADGGMIQIRQYSDPVLTAGQGSVVVSSDQQLGSIVQIQARAPQVASYGAYNGASSGSSTVYIPILAHQGNSSSGKVNSQIIIQNVDTTVLDVDVELVPRTGYTTAYTKAITSLQPGASFYYDLADETNLGDINTPWFGSAVITTTGSVFAVSNLFLGVDALQTFNGTPIEDINSEWNVPLFLSRLSNGVNTVVSGQNIDGSTILAGNLILNCTPDSTRPTLSPFSVANASDIPNNGAWEFNSVTNLSIPADWYGSCQVSTSTGQDIIAMVQSRWVGVSPNNGAAAYEALPVGTTDLTMMAPLILKRLTNGFATVATIQNLSSTNEANITLVYKPSLTECPVATCDVNHDGSVTVADSVTVIKVIAANSSIQRNHRLASSSTSPDAEITLPDNWTGSLVVTSSDQPIAGYIQITNYLDPTGDKFMSYVAFTTP